METESQKLVIRLRELCQAVVAHDMSQFTMSIPAEPDRDADLVLAVAAMRIEELAIENAALITTLEGVQKDAARYRWLCDQDDTCDIQVLQGISWENMAMCCALPFQEGKPGIDEKIDAVMAMEQP